MDFRINLKFYLKNEKKNTIYKFRHIKNIFK